jgi:hypothetical protein
MAGLLGHIKDNLAIIEQLAVFTGSNGLAWLLTESLGPPSVSRSQCAYLTATVMILAWAATGFFFRKYHSSRKVRSICVISAMSLCVFLIGWYSLWSIEYMYTDSQGNRHVKGYEHSHKLKAAMKSPRVELPPGVLDVQDYIRPDMSEQDIRKIIGDDEYQMYEAWTIDRMKQWLLVLWLFLEGTFAFAIGVTVAAWQTPKPSK